MKKLFARLGIKNKADFFGFVGQFFKFGIVGVTNTMVHLGIYYILLYLGAHYLVANFFGFAIGVLNAFYWNRKFVFKSNEKIPRQLAKVYAAYSFSFFLGMGTLFLMVDILGLSALIAPLINICITTPINFLVNKFWVFRARNNSSH